MCVVIFKCMCMGEVLCKWTCGMIKVLFCKQAIPKVKGNIEVTAGTLKSAGQRYKFYSFFKNSNLLHKQNMDKNQMNITIRGTLINPSWHIE